MYCIFAKDYKVYLFDRRPVVQEGMTVRDMASDIDMAIDRLDLVKKLVLAVTISKNNDTVKQVVNKWIEMAELENMKELIADIAEKMYSDACVNRYRLFMPLLTILQKTKNVQRFVILAKACLTCNAYESLNKIKCPVFVFGEQKG